MTVISTENGYIQLCAAIVLGGIESNDREFLESDWCETLMDAVMAYHNKPTDEDTYTFRG